MVTTQALFDNLATEVVNFVPRLAGALLILVVGWIAGAIIGRLVAALIGRTELDSMVHDTAVGRMFGRRESTVSRTFGMVAKWFVFALAFLAAADVLAISLLSQWVAEALAYLPAFFGGLVFIMLGMIVADFAADMIGRTQRTTRSAITDWFAKAVRVFLYFIVIVIGLDTMGVEVEFLFIFARALAWGTGIAIALAVGIGLGWGSKEYVASNIDTWMSGISEERRRDGAK
jgi:hypothetical protein